MPCREKINLQRTCTEAWDSYESYTRDAGLPGLPDLMKFHKMMSTMWNFIDRSDPERLESAFREVFQLRSEHMKASRALSLHLARHRC